jgi:hypothetical protein
MSSVREGRLGILVEELHVGVGRGAVEVEIVFFDVLAVVALAVGQAEEAFLENGVLTVPQGQGEAEPLLVIGQAGDAVLAPAVGPGAGLIVGEVVPGVAALAVILPHRTPLALAQIGAPLLPGRFAVPGLFQTYGFFIFGCHGSLRCLGSPST